MTGKILIVDDVATNRIVLKVKLSAAQYQTIMAEDGNQALALARRMQPDLILMDVLMPGRSGLDVCAKLKADPVTSGIKIILITALDDNDSRMAGLEAGADDFLSRPVDEVALLARVRSLLRARDQERELHLREATFAELGFPEESTSSKKAACVMLVANTLAASKAWKERLDDRMLKDITYGTGDDALRLTADDNVPDVFAISVDQQERNGGLRLMSDLRSRATTRHSAIIIVLPHGDSERAATALDLGANDISYEPFLAPELAVRIRTQLERKTRADRLRATLDDGLRLAVTDSLTGLYNRRYGMRHLERVARQCKETGTDAAAIMIDVDHFKTVNDAFGHLVGDQILKEVAATLRASLRGEDLVTRIGGEEFLAILPEASVEQARIIAERLRSGIETLQLPNGHGGHVSVTLSLGVTMLSGANHNIEEILKSVDRALYTAKATGRNSVVVSA